MNESELIEAAKAGCNDAKTALLQMHAGFIAGQAKRQCRNAQDFDDYHSLAMIAFLHAVDRFDASRECSLIGYAGMWISQRLRRYRESDQTVRPAYNRTKRMQRREAMGDYTGEKLDDKRSEYDQQFSRTTISLNAPVFDDGEDLIDCISSSTPTPEDNVLESERLRILRERLCGMPAREVLTLLRGDSTLQDVGKRFHVSRERIRQIEVTGMRNMRATYAKDAQ